MPLVSVRVRALCGVAALAAVACQSKSTLSAQAPQLVVTPATLSVQPIPVGHTSLSIVQVTNTGSADLHFKSAPAVSDLDNDGLDSEFSLASILDHDCSGGKRATPLTVAPGECARIVVQYAPGNVDSDSGEIKLETDDPDHPVVHVPIAMGDAAKLVICAVDAGGNETCDAPSGAAPTVQFGHANKGQTLTRTLRIKNAGKSALEISAILDPDGPSKAEYARDISAVPQKLQPGAKADVPVKFTPVGGGFRNAWIEIDSLDPVRPSVNVPLQGQGDGPALCADPSPMDFGATDIGVPVDKTLTLTSCGTAPVQMQQLSFDTLSSSAFSSTNLPAPQTLAVGASVTATIHFRPDQPGATQGALLTPTPEVPDAYVLLKGSGNNVPVCRIGSSTSTVDFGQVVRGQSADRSVSLANRGSKDCVLSSMLVTLGGAYFSVVNPLSAAITLRPGDATMFTLRYSPPAADGNSQDNGTAEAVSTDAVLPKLDLTLTGTPVATPVCKLRIVPGQNGIPGISGRTLQFGNVTVGHTKVLPATFANVGSADCNLSSYKLVALGGIIGGPCSNSNCQGYSVVSPLPTNPIHPGGSTQVNIQFKPADSTEVSFIPTAYLDVQTGDTSIASECTQEFPPNTNDGCVHIGLSGQGIVSTLAVLPSDLDFGLVTLGCKSKTENVTLYNTGNGAFNIKSFHIDPATSPFLVVAPPTPFQMAPGAKVQIQVTYRPSQAAVENATLYIESDASNTTSNNPYITVGLKGTGTTDKHQVDTFVQDSKPVVDLLFVMDNSSSMQDKQAAISQQAPAFIANALKFNADYHIGVTTTEADQTDTANGDSAYQGDKIYVGGLFGHPGIIDGTTANPADAFSKNIKVGTCCSDSRESGLETAWRALTPNANQTPAPQGSQGFLRDDSRLVMVAVSDEEDQSHGSTDFYVDFFTQLKGKFNAGLVSFNSIMGDPSTGCDANGVHGDAGDRYADVDKRTGGQWWSICTADWGQIANELSLGAFQGRKQFPLTRYADPATVQTTLTTPPSTTPVPQNQPADYSFDQPSNSVVFVNVPAAGATITVAYDAQCF